MERSRTVAKRRALFCLRCSLTPKCAGVSRAGAVSYSFDIQHVEGGTNLRRHGRPRLQTVASSALLTGTGEESSSATRKFMDRTVIWTFHVEFSRGPCWGKSHGISGATSAC